MNRYRQIATTFGLITAIALTGCAAMQEDPENEIELALDEVPASILTAARAAIPGIEFDSAEYEEEEGQMVYELEGMVGEQRYEIELSESGEVIEIEEIDD